MNTIPPNKSALQWVYDQLTKDEFQLELQAAQERQARLLRAIRKLVDNQRKDRR